MRARTLDVAVRANTQNFEGGMKNVSKVLRNTIVGLNAFSGAAAGSEKSTIGMVNAVAIGLASGGPWGAALAGAGIAVGAFIGQAKEAEEAWKRAMASMRADTEKFEKAARDASARLFEFRGGSGFARDFTAKLREAQQIAFEARAAQANLAATPEQGVLAEWLGMLGSQKEAKGLAGKAGDRLDEAKKQVLALLAAGKDQLALTIEQAEWEERILSTTDERAKKLLEIQRATFLSQQQIVQLVNAGLELPAGMETADVLALFERIGQLKAGGLDAVTESVKHLTWAGQAAADSLFALLDGIFIRGARARDMLRDVARSAASLLLRQGIQTLATQAFGVPTPP